MPIMHGMTKKIIEDYSCFPHFMFNFVGYICVSPVRMTTYNLSAPIPL